MTAAPRAILALADGRVFSGRAIGALRRDPDLVATGEVVFNTAMTGYQEILTDPSYHGQHVVMTAPQIGNYGVNAADAESRRPWAAGLVVRELSPVTSNWRAEGDLDDYLARGGIPGIEGLDTRALTRHIRLEGAMMAALGRGDADTLVDRARAAGSMEGQDLVAAVSCDAPFLWTDAGPDSAAASRIVADPDAPAAGPRVVVWDYGVKYNILRELRGAGAEVVVVPARTGAEAALALRPDGFFLSNGPGDPAAVTYAIDTTRQLLGKAPLFGICLGHQILGLALGGRTFKLKFGHHGANHPVAPAGGGRVEITSQNHGFCVDIDSLRGAAEPTWVNLNDHTLEGLRAPDLDAEGIQYHPEASPGPHDAAHHIREFVRRLQRAK